MDKYTTYSVYSITCLPIDKRYIGQTNNLARREFEHFAMLREKRHPNLKLQVAFNIYGEGAFKFEVLELSVLPREINRREKYWIEFYKSYEKGFNRNPGTNTDKSLPITFQRIISIPQRDLTPIELSLKETAEFEPHFLTPQTVYWCMIGKHDFYAVEGLVLMDSKGKMCCPICYKKNRLD